jgi:HK97 family phage portal protein
MALFDSILEKRSISYNLQNPDPKWNFTFSGFGNYSSKSGQVITEDVAMKISAFYLGIRIIAETIGSLPFNIYQKQNRGRRLATDHPAYKLLHVAPNRFQTPMQFKEMMVGHCVIRGKAAARKIRNNGGRVVALIPMHPDKIEMKFNDFSGDPYFEITHTYKENGLNVSKIEVLQKEDVFWIYGLSLGLTPVSPLEAMADTLGISVSTSAYKSNFFRNGSTPSGILSHPSFFKDKKEIEDLKEEIDSQTRGENQFSTMVLQNGLTWQQVGMKNSDAELIKTDVFQVLEIARALRIQPHKLMELGDASRANIEQMAIEHVIDTIRPWAVRVEEAVNRDLLSEREREQGYYGKFILDALLRGDTASRTAAYTAGRQWGWLSADDVLELEDKNPLPDGIGDSYLVPANMIDARAVPTTLEPVDPVSSAAAERSIQDLLKITFDKIVSRQQKNFDNKRNKNQNIAEWFEDFAQKETDVARSMLQDVVTPLVPLMAISERAASDLIELSLIDIKEAWKRSESLDGSKLTDLIMERIRNEHR